VIDEAYQAMLDMHALRWQRPKQGHQQVGAVHLIVRKTEGVDDRVRERSTQEGAAILPTALVECERPHTHRRQIVAEPEPVQDTGRVRAHLDARTNLTDRTRLLVHMHVEAGPVERERGGKATDSTTDDRQRKRIPHVTNDTPSGPVSPTAGAIRAPGPSVLSFAPEVERAGRLWGAVEAEEVRGPLGQWELERDEYSTRVLANTGPDFETARGAGRVLALDEAIGYALSVDSPP
jgi:hypothetical protein